MLRHPTSPAVGGARQRRVHRERGEDRGPRHPRHRPRRPASSAPTPTASATANLVGFTNTNQKTRRDHRAVGHRGGVQQLLTGTTGSEQVMTRAPTACRFRWRAAQDTPAKDGESIKLTIDPRAAVPGAAGVPAGGRQDQGGELLGRGHAAEDRRHPRHGPVAHLRPGHVHQRGQTTDIPDHYMFDPGSTAKVITAAAALEQGGQTPMSAYNIPYAIYRGGQAIHDAEWSPGERYTIAGIIANSSNVGMSQVVEHVPAAGPVRLPEGVRARPADRPRPAGRGAERRYAPTALPPPSQWAGDERYTLSYGQGISVNAVQMASVYATIANNGVRVAAHAHRRHLQRGGAVRPGQAVAVEAKVIQPKTAKELISILQQVPGVDDAGQPALGRHRTATRSRPRPAPRASPRSSGRSPARRPTRCASTGRATSAWRRATARRSSSR